MSDHLVPVIAAGALLSLLGAVLVARRLMAAGYTWADALVIEAVAAIGAIGAVQSYTALRWLFLLGDLPEWQADVAPATVDLIAAVFGLAALTARRRGDRDRYADRLALGYSVAAVLANLAAAGLDVAAHPATPNHGYPLARVVVVLLSHTAPVVTFLLGSHWLMRRRTERRGGEDAADLRAALATARAELAEARAELSNAAGTLRPARRRALNGAHTERAPEHDPTANGRVPDGERPAQVRALLAAEGRLTGTEIGARLGIDAGYARRLRAAVEADMAKVAAPNTAPQEVSA